MPAIHQFSCHFVIRILSYTSLFLELEKHGMCKANSLFGVSLLWLLQHHRARPSRRLPTSTKTSSNIGFIKFDVGSIAMITGGRNRECVGVIKNREKHKGGFETIHLQDVLGHKFATRLGNVFTIGKGTKPWVSLPKGKGVKLSIIKEDRKRLAASGVAAMI
ncbi:small ribosomal subunit protein eS4x-like [Elaeis guineensis]|uniref:small ribosomal subunit protein eS4x-like n=1 Tax=Elaeis guineensis var. tenera TaxID=51953 RepID=UPI003C6DADF2